MSNSFTDMIYAPKKLSIDLVEGLVDRGHDVIFATAPDIVTKAHVLPGDQRFLDGIAPIKHPNPADQALTHQHFLIKRDYEVDLIARAFGEAARQPVDCIHVYSVTMAHYFEEYVTCPVIYTLHDPLPKEGSLGYRVFEKFPHHRYVTISNSQRAGFPLPLHFEETVYHGINAADYPYSEMPSDYVLFMGRLVPEKGLHNAIAAAITSNSNLEIGTDFRGHDHDPYFESQIRPHLADPRIKEPGLVGDGDKVRLYGGAKAFLFPIEWEEPFGMVMIEAMACGTPVIAYNRGSVSEIVRDGVTGFIIDQDAEDRPGRGSWTIKTPGVPGLVEAMARIGEIDRVAARRHVEERFSSEMMVGAYEKVYERLVSAGK